MGCCIQSGYIPEEQPSTDADSQYTLNALRSLEGVARLWSEQFEEVETERINSKKRNSVPVRGNNNTISNHLPIAISTYFFLKSPGNQPNLIQSHTSPQNKVPQNLRNNTKQINHIQNIIIEENNGFDEFKRTENENGTNITPEYENENNGTFVASPSFHLTLPNSLGTDGVNLGLNLMPVFSDSDIVGSPQSHSVGSPHIILTPLSSLNENECNEFNMNDAIFPEHVGMDNYTKMTKTFSTNNVFTLNDMHLNCDDFMEYNTDNLGFGASGVVTKAFHFSSCIMVAIKQCRSKKKDEIIAFEKEAKLYKKFKNNNNIIDLIGFGADKENNSSLMALELMDLNSTYSLKINENIHDINVKELIVGHIALNVLSALNELHKNNYVHNDIKPENILCNKYGEIKLSDFGTMLQLKNNEIFLYKNNGTQKFQSPEKTTLNNIKYNTKSDIWSLGITCYELLFGEMNIDEISYTVNPPILSSEKHNLSQNCCNFINQCLIINQFNRPNTNKLLKHSWFKQKILKTKLNDKWPYIKNIKYQNEDLLFMITALICYYSNKQFNDKNNGSIQRLHRRISIQQKNKNNGKIFSDKQRIENIAKYAFCEHQHVIDRIKVTVSYIKSQLNKNR